MKVIVLGAGVIGVTTAYQLVKAGHEVTVHRPTTGSGVGDQLRKCRGNILRLNPISTRPISGSAATANSVMTYVPTIGFRERSASDGKSAPE